MGCCDAIQVLCDWEKKSGMKLDIDARDQYGATALIKATERHHVSVVRKLLNHKAGVNLYDNYRFTALHAAIYEPNTKWFDFHFFCKGFLERTFDRIDSPKMWPIGGKLDSYAIIDQANDSLQNYLERSNVTTRCKEVVKLLLDKIEINANATDFGGNTPLDLAVKSSKGISSPTFEALKNRGAIQNLREPKDELPIEVTMVDERGRNPLHRRLIYTFSYFKEPELIRKRSDLMTSEILLSPKNPQNMKLLAALQKVRVGGSLENLFKFRI